MKYGFTFAKLAKEGKVVNVGLMPEFDKYSNDSTWTIDDKDLLIYNHKTEELRLEVYEFVEDSGWELQETVVGPDAEQVALDSGVLYLLPKKTKSPEQKAKAKARRLARKAKASAEFDPNPVDVSFILR